MNSILFGGHTGSETEGAAFTGNRLELKTAVRMYGVENFEFIDFCLPSKIEAGGVMLKLAEATNLDNVKVDLKFDSSRPRLAVGDTITLINKEVTISGYTFEIWKSDGSLAAKVVAATSKKGGGSGCNGFTISLGLLTLFAPFALKR